MDLSRPTGKISVKCFDRFFVMKGEPLPLTPQGSVGGNNIGGVGIVGV